MFSPQAIFFDLDGTLADSLPDLAWATDQMMLTLGKAPPGKTLVKHWVGNGAARLIKRALTNSMDGEPNKREFERGKKLFEHFYKDNLAVRSELYPGVHSTLEILFQGGTPMVCITNKPEQFTIPLLKKLNINHYFSICISGDTLANKKPHPEAILYAAKYNDQATTDCLMVGDSKNDIQAAKAAGCPAVAVTYGYNHGEDIRNENPEATIEHFDDLLGLIKPVNPR